MTLSKATAQLDALNSAPKTGMIVAFPRLYSGSQSHPGLALKRCFDVLFSCAGLALVAPILLLALIVIPIQSFGSPLFVQRRVGKNGKIFNILKLRTMRVGSELHEFRTAAEDTRLTSVGKFLRSTNIDELPQLINVIAGDMSLIGPRPLSLHETTCIVETLNLQSDHPGLIPTMRPGLIGLEQINRVRELTYGERFAFNNEYESGWTISRDLQIFARGLLICKEVCLVSLIGAVIVGIFALMYFVRT